MNWLKNSVAVLLILAVCVWGVFFGLKNTAQIPLNLVFIEFTNARVSFWLVGSFALGGALGMLVSLWMLLQLKAKQAMLKRQLEQCKEARVSSAATPAKVN